MNKEYSADIGIIGGTGIYDSKIITKTKKIEISTPYGQTSDLITIGDFENKKVAFMPRHGKSHKIPPHKINYRANIWAMKELGVKWLLAPSAVGSLREELKPGDIVIPDQFIDRTKNRENTFYDGPQVAHISTAYPFCRDLANQIDRICKNLKYSNHLGGTYICIEGPRFSTKSESKMFRNWGADIIGMTVVPECILAREVEICYVNIATVTDYDVWAENTVNTEEIIKTLNNNISKTRNILREIMLKIAEDRKCDCKDALKDAMY